MPLSRSPLDPDQDHRPNRRGLRVAQVATALALVGVGVVAIQRTGSGPGDVHTKGPDLPTVVADDGRPGELGGRPSAGLPLVVETGPGTSAVLPEPTGQGDAQQPGGPDTRRVGRSPSPTTRSGAGGTAGGRGPTPTGPSPGGTMLTPARPVVSTPGSAAGKPVADDDRAPEDQSVAPDPFPPVLVQPPAPAPDEKGCPNLDLEPIGGSALTEPLRDAFRALLPELGSGTDDLICGHPLEPWRDLTVQRLQQAGNDAGVIIAAADGSSIALRLAPNEWTGYRFRYGGGPTGFNFLGYPVGRERYAGTEVIRTTGGGLVMPTSGTIGIPVVGAAWEVWMAHGGPGGDMGIPLSLPSGIQGVGAYQDFTRGRLLLPGVTTDIEAFSLPASAYEWHPASEFPLDPLDYRGKLIEVTGISYYIDSGGVAHWIATTSDWMCAKWDLGATPMVVPGYVLGSFVIGDVFTCPNR